MTAGGRVAGFAALLAAIFALAAIAGRGVGPAGVADGAVSEPRADGGAGAHAPARAATAGAAAPELRLAARDTTLTPGRAQQFSFQIQDAAGAAVRDFEVQQGRRMHLVVVRRDLRRFQHLHPTRDARGTWSARLTLPDAGVYQAFADFQSGGERQALGVDLFAAL